MREAVGRVEDHGDLLPEVLRTFVWALPYQMPASTDVVTVIAVTIDGVARWALTSAGPDGWTLTEGQADDPTATVQLSPDAAWRSFVGAAVATDQVTVTGARELTDAVMRVRAIIV
jgi:hypothetical protein